MTKKSKIIFIICLALIGVSSRLLPHAWNFTPLAAIALFAGAYFNRKYALILPLLIVFISDLFLGFYEWPLMLTVYLSYILIGVSGVLLKNRVKVGNVIMMSLFSSLVFFLLTNWAVWQFSPWYTKSFNGLLECYVLALPFFRNSLLGDLFFTGAFFGAYEYAKIYLAKKDLIKAAVEI